MWSIESVFPGAGAMAQPFRALTALAGHVGLVLSTHNVAHDHVQPVIPVHGDLAPFLSTRHAHATHTYMQASTCAH